MPRILNVLVVALAGDHCRTDCRNWRRPNPPSPASVRISPEAGIFIGNSFFYYNNGLPGHLSLMEKAADPENKKALPQHHGDDRRLRLRLA